METDYDNLIGFWIKDVPYLWVQGKTPDTSKRFYISYNIGVFDKENHILDSQGVQIYTVEGKIDPVETFSLLPFPTKKECDLVRDYFLVWTFFPIQSLHLAITQKEKISPWTNKVDIRIEGKKVDKSELSRLHERQLKISGTIEITSYNKKLATFPGIFGNHLVSTDPKWLESGKLLYYPRDDRDPFDFNDITEAKQFYGLSDQEITEIHVQALYNLLAELNGKLKKVKDASKETLANTIRQQRNDVIQELIEMGETPSGNEKLKYGWIYSKPDVLVIRYLYNVVMGNQKMYPIRDALSGKIYPAPYFCYISSPLKDWIQGDKYYQDRKRKWEFELPAKDGYQELCLLSHEVQKLFEENMSIMKSKYSDEEIDRIIEDGRRIYDKKPSFKTGVTWSQDDYSHLGLQREYLRYKSIQRFTETWELMRRANNLGLLRRITDDPNKRTIRVCSMAGGPGFELYAIKRFFHKYYPHIKVIGASLDLEGSWRPYADIMGFTFQHWNTIDGKNFIRKCGGKIDIAIVSYSLYMYMSENEHINWLSQQILSGEIPILLVNSRKKNLQNHKDRMAIKGVVSTPLLKQTKGRDDRQMVYHSPQLKIRAPTLKIETMFPNVPFE